MRHRYLGGALLAAAAMLAAPSAARAQFTSGEGAGFPPPLNSEAPLHTEALNILPTGQSGDAGFYAGIEFVMLTQTKAIGNQTIARRGFYDMAGTITGVPGAFVGSGQEALNPRMFSRTTYQPGFNLELGYRFSDGTRFFVNYMQLIEAHYSQGASTIPPFFQTGTDLSNTFLSSPVFNFNNMFAGPLNKVQGVPSLDSSGIWNAASQMDMKYTQRFQQLQSGLRVPVL
ncbi:MAG TPA: hypothetical protein VLM40_12035, partial [Gemmata sp.]|nr:hypothetical protein [Gemmata sp.]